MRLPLRIVACPRSGTLYTAKLLRSKGWRVGWEHFDRDGIVSWMSTVPSTWVPFGQAPCAGVSFDNTIGIVRDPLKCIGSIQVVCLNPPSLVPFLKFVRQFIDLPDEDTLAMATKFWIQWIELIQKQKPKIIVQIENDPEMIVNFAWEYLPDKEHPYESHPDSNCHHVCNNYPTVEQIYHATDVATVDRLIQTANRIGYTNLE